MIVLLTIAGFSLYCAVSLSARYWIANNLPFNKDDMGMDFFNKPDPKLSDGIDDDYDKKFKEFEKEYYDF